MSASYLLRNLDAFKWDPDDLKHKDIRGQLLISGHATAVPWWLIHLQRLEGRSRSHSLKYSGDQLYTMGIPFQISLSSPLGRLGSFPDLRLGLVGVSWGQQKGGPDEAIAAGGLERSSAWISIISPDSIEEAVESGSAEDEVVYSKRWKRPPHQKKVAEPSQRLWPFYRTEDVLHCSGALLLLTAMMPDLAVPTVKKLSRRCIDTHVAVMLWRWGAQMVRSKRKAQAKLLAAVQESPVFGGCSANDSSSAEVPEGGKTKDRNHRQLSLRTCPRSNPAAAAFGMCLRLAAAAQLLMACGSLWSAVHPSSHSVAVALMTLLSVSFDSGRLRRDIDSGRIPPGERRNHSGVFLIQGPLKQYGCSSTVALLTSSVLDLRLHAHGRPYGGESMAGPPQAIGTPCRPPALGPVPVPAPWTACVPR